MQGYIKLYRQIIENPIWLIKPFSEGQAWVDLLCIATFDKGFIKSKNGQIIQLKRGDCGYSILSLSKRWGWSRGKVTRYLSLLNEQKMIQQKTDGKLTIISIINFDKYQNQTTNDTTNDTTNGQQMIQQTDTINNDNNDKNDNNGNKDGKDGKSLIPSKEEIEYYAHNQLGKSLNVDDFFNWYDAVQWKDKDGLPINWKQKVITWIRTQKDNKPAEPHNHYRQSYEVQIE